MILFAPNEAVMVYMATCLKEVLVRLILRLCKQNRLIDFTAVA
jgi:hypothetical protein